MSVSSRDRLYNLLPALYRQLDERQGQPLRALMAVLESEFRLLEADIAAMYDDWFIETCDLWVVPYIADLLGLRNLKDVYQIPSQRRLVANSIAYRRRKGTLAVIEKVVRDATGWYARSVEYAHLISYTQHMERVQLENGRTVDVHHLHGASLADAALESLAHTLDVDNSDQGEFNGASIGLYLYRLRSYPIRRSFAHPIAGHPGCYTFDPLGQYIPLFNQPRPVVHISQRAQPVNLPLPILQADLAADLQEYRALYGSFPINNQPAESRYYGPDRSLYIKLSSRSPVIKPSSVVSMDLSEWPAESSLPGELVAAVDVERGRIAFIDQSQLPEPVDVHDKARTFRLRNWPRYVIVNYNYGFSSELGGGPYHREFQLPYPAESCFQINVAKGTVSPDDAATGNDLGNGDANLPGCVPTLQDALAIWERQKNPRAVIRILDNGVYDERLEIKLPKGTQLSIVADTSVRPIIGKSEKPIIVYPDESIKANNGIQDDRRLHLNGLFLHGGLQIDSQEQKETTGKLIVTIEHCTLAKSEDSGLKLAPVQSEQAVRGLELNIERSILGPLYLPATTANVRVRYSIVDNGTGYAIATDPKDPQPGPAVNLERVTIFGQVYARKVVASEVIFCDPLRTSEKGSQIHHSFVPQGSIIPKDEVHPSISRDITRPHFTSTHYGDPAYAQLSLYCPRQIREGTVDGSEMGAFHDLYQVLAEEKLREMLEEYLPVGLHASIHYVT
jgi:hypothetical protein